MFHVKPFCLKGISTQSTEKEPNKWNIFSSEVRKKAERAKKVAEKYNLTFIELQNKFDKATEVMEDAYWLEDGVHPSAMGHELIKREWLKAFNCEGM